MYFSEKFAAFRDNSVFSDPSSELVDGRPPRRGPSNEWRRSDNVMGPVLKGNKQSNFEAPHRRDPRAIRNVDISMVALSFVISSSFVANVDSSIKIFSR